MERHSFRIVSDWNGTETMWKLCLYTKFPHQEIRWNYGIFTSVIYLELIKMQVEAAIESLKFFREFPEKIRIVFYSFSKIASFQLSLSSFDKKRLYYWPFFGSFSDFSENFFIVWAKGCLPQILLGPFLNTWQISPEKRYFYHCINSVRIRSYSGPYFLTFGLSTERYEVLSVFSPNSGKHGTE